MEGPENLEVRMDEPRQNSQHLHHEQRQQSRNLIGYGSQDDTPAPNDSNVLQLVIPTWCLEKSILSLLHEAADPIG